jgi:LysR family transcriptional regulator, regulator for bpeEF and oprC
MDLDALRAFVKVVQTGSFTRAAEALGTQKAHLSRVISAFEAKLGVRLIERTTRSLSLTEVGRELHERAVAILAAIEDTERVASHLHDAPRGQLRLTCGVEFGMMRVGSWIRGYLRKFPEVTVDADFTARIVDLVHEGFDLAIRVGELADSGLVARRLGALQYGLYASGDYLARKGTPAAPEELKAHELLMFSAGSHRGGWRLLCGARQVRVERSARLRVNNSFAVRDATIDGLGIAQLPSLIADADVHAGRLLRILPDWQPDPVPVHAVFPSARYLTPKVRAFIDHAVAAFDGAT